MREALREAREIFEKELGTLGISPDTKADAICRMASTIYIRSSREEVIEESEPATPKQKEYMGSLGIDFSEDISKSEASKLIGQKLAAKKTGVEAGQQKKEWDVESKPKQAELY